MASLITSRKAGLPGSLSQVGLAPGVTVSNGQFLYNGKPLTQDQWNALNAGGFMPYQPPTSALPGTYDPSLDAQGENANLGFGWNAQDYELGRARLTNDFNTANQRLDQNHGFTLSDLLTGNQRANADLDTQLGYTNADFTTQSGRLGEDYRTATGDLTRQYRDLGINQAGAIRAAGGGEGGALAQALAKRQANQGIDQSRIDTGYNRSTQDLTTSRDRTLAGIGTARTRANEDYNTGVSRENTEYGRNKYDLGLNYQRQGDDALTGYQRAGVANDAFQRQVNALKVYQAQQQGLLPEGPSNERTAQSGPNARKVYRTEIHNGVVYHRYSDGRMVPIRKASK